MVLTMAGLKEQASLGKRCCRLSGMAWGCMDAGHCEVDRAAGHAEQSMASAGWTSPCAIIAVV